MAIIVTDIPDQVNCKCKMDRNWGWSRTRSSVRIPNHSKVMRLEPSSQGPEIQVLFQSKDQASHWSEANRREATAELKDSGE